MLCSRDMKRAPHAEEPDQAATVVQSKPGSGETDEPARFLLVVVEGPDRGQRFVIDGTQPSRSLLGQSPACEIRLADPQVSRRHVALETKSAALRVTDLGSTNGTFVDRVRVFDAELHGEELLRVGATLLRVERDDTAEVSVPPATSFGRIVGASVEMRRLYPLCLRLAASDVPVVLEGETGTGKEVLAESLHEQGPRAAGPFVVFDCTAVPPNLVESELFGHERGAFTGAVGARRGIFEQAHGGTLLIDEIGDLDPMLQPKLLRALEKGEIRRVGGDRWVRVDVRVLAATRRDLDREVQAGRFRDDLFHRLVVARIELPPLRERRGDVRLLTAHFCRELGGDEHALPADLLARWEDSPWPGNVRELRNSIARRIALGELAVDIRGPSSAEDPATDPDAGDVVESLLRQGLPYTVARDRLLLAFEERYVQRVLSEHGNDVSRAAAASGIGRRYFQKIRARHNH
jgi:DNA-binding NtrC family response regulator